MRLITLGDCLVTNIAGSVTWVQQLSRDLNCEYISFGIMSSQNLLQIQLMQDWLLDNDLKEDDIVIWQIGFSYHPLVHISEEYYDIVKKVDERIRRKIPVSRSEEHTSELQSH